MVVTSRRRLFVTTLAVTIALAAALPPLEAAADAPAASAAAPAAAAEDADAVARRLLVTLAAGADAGTLAERLPAGVELRQVGDRLVFLDADSPAQASRLADELRTAPSVARVEADGWAWPLAAVAGPSGRPAVDDPLFDRQWALYNDGDEVDGIPGRAGLDLDIARAWAWTQGRADVVVAVIDSGLDLDHPDLAGALWTNPGEQADGEDTDGNGYVDDVHGYDFRNRRGQLEDADGHGTAVSGLLAARADDGVGIAGVAPGVSLMVLRAFASDGTNTGTPLSVLAEAILYAVDHGADVINASWVTYDDRDTLREVVAGAGVPIVAAAGNDAFDPTAQPGDRIAYPAGYDLPNVVGVTAVDHRGQVPDFANTDRARVHLGAPGSGLVAPLPGGGHATEALLKGTSFAVPHVTGTLALAASVAPYATPAELIDATLRTTTVLTSLQGRTITGGMVDAGAAVTAVRRPHCRPDRTPPLPFPDVEPDGVHASAVACLAGFGIVEGTTDGEFLPGATVRRGQMAAFLARALDAAGHVPSGAGPTFGDIEGHTHQRAIEAVAAAGIARGDELGRFRPDDPVSRAQVASFVTRTHTVLTGSQPAPSRSWFTDTERSPHRESVDVARDLGIVAGVDATRFDPRGDTSRAQMASFLARLLDAVGREGIAVNERAARSTR